MMASFTKFVRRPFVIERYLAAILPLWKRLAANVREAHTLDALGGTLLPKLISGELRVQEAQELAETSA